MLENFGLKYIYQINCFLQISKFPIFAFSSKKLHLLIEINEKIKILWSL